jgi:hypothetical protein
MDWIVPVSPEEKERGELRPETERDAYAAFDKSGCVLLRGIFPTQAIDVIYQDYMSRYGTLNARDMKDESTKPLPNPFHERDNGRFEITPRMSGALGTPEIYGNPLFRKFLTPLLGHDMRLTGYTIIVSHPGATLQRIHRDHAFLFDKADVGQNLPPYAVNVAVPLFDVDIDTGPTGIWPGSHRWPKDRKPLPETVSVTPWQRGDCMVIDYRTLHTGLPNHRRVRPILYLVYARTWFYDEVNQIARASIDMPLEDYQSLAAPLRSLLARGYSQATLMKAAEAERVAPVRTSKLNPRDPSSWGKVGRNEPCPCGSGKKYKQCHERAA